MNHNATPRRNHTGWWVALGLVIVLCVGFWGGAEWQRIRIATGLAEVLSSAPGFSPKAPAGKAPKLDGPVTVFGAGMYEVGPDVVAGRYKTPGPGESFPCYWQRTKDDTGSFDSVITSGSVDGPASVTIKAGEFFDVSGSCEWTKV